jgi:predicted transposase YdaD
MLGITLKETRVYREIREEGEKALVLRQLTRRVGELPQQVRQRVESLSLEQLENLGEALLDFTSMADLETWLEALES